MPVKKPSIPRIRVPAAEKKPSVSKEELSEIANSVMEVAYERLKPCFGELCKECVWREHELCDMWPRPGIPVNTSARKGRSK